MSKLREDVRVAMLGAAAGLFSISVVLLIARIDAYYAYLSWLKDANRFPYEEGIENLTWIPISFWHILLSVGSSLLVHRYVKTTTGSLFLLWQAVGFTTLLGWGLTILLAVSIECLVSGNLNALQHIIMNSRDAAFIAKYVSTVFACNVLYGSVIKAASRQYMERYDCDPE